MINAFRKLFNEDFSTQKYDSFLAELNKDLPQPIPFRIAETPVFIDKKLGTKLIAAGDKLISAIKKPDFKNLTENAIPEQWRVGGHEGHPHFLTFDFALVKGANGQLEPKLIELQGFPSLYGFQTKLDDTFRKIYPFLDDSMSVHPTGLSRSAYLDLLSRTITGRKSVEKTWLMDVDVMNQKTVVDFAVTQKLLGIQLTSWEDIHQKGSQIFSGEMRVERIYNRLIFDEITGQIQANNINLKEPLDVQWVTHPNWFYRISKYLMPFLSGNFMPETRFLNDFQGIPSNLENYVLKPLFSFAGTGVKIDVAEADIDEIDDPENWILQHKVHYEPFLEAATGGGVKAEIRLMYLWPEEDEDPTLAINLARLSRGKMIGVNYNKDFDFVGGTVAYFEQ